MADSPLDAAALLGAVVRRKAVRRYDMTPLEAAALGRVRALAASCDALFEDSPVEVRLVEDAALASIIVAGLVGPFVKVNKAPHHLVLIARRGEHDYENVGFAGEKAVLGLTAMGLGSCWVGWIRPKVIAEALRLPEDNFPVATITFGRALDEKKAFRESVSEFNRMPLPELLLPDSEPPEGIVLTALEAARLAPSGMNRQPWRFRVAGEGLEVWARKDGMIGRRLIGELSRIDPCIALRHASLAFEAAGGRLVPTGDKPPERRDLRHVVTMRIVRP